MIKNQELAKQIFLIVDKMIEISNQLKICVQKNETEKFKECGQELYAVIKELGEISPSLKEEESGLSLPASLESIKCSLIKILSLQKKDESKAIRKIEFELIPLIEEMRINFYWWGIVYPDQKKINSYYKNDVFELGTNRYVADSEKTGNYVYDLSVFVLAYNKIEYTRMCLDSLYKNLPSEITYEIILVNHGSNDGTKELFESYQPDKQLDIAANGGGSNAVFRIAQGKYIMMISNDIIITPNAIDNMYKCIDSDERIAWVVPTTPNVSNLQTISGQYSSYEEMMEFAKQNNVSDPYRWEQRVRLCNPVDMVRASFLEETKAQYVFHSKNRMSFPDDRKSLICRRNNYKMYLVKDAFCYHYGSVTLGKDASTNSQLAYEQGRKDFFEAFGIDPWVSSCCYDYNLARNLYLTDKEQVKILGVNCGLGSNPLKIKETLKEVSHNRNCFIRNCLDDEKFLYDIKSISDDIVIGLREKLKEIDEKYDYIVDESMFGDIEEIQRALELYKTLLEKRGMVSVLCSGVIEQELGDIVEGFEKMVVIKNARNSLMPENSMWLLLYR